MYKISASFVESLLNTLRGEGLDEKRLCREAGIDMRRLGAADAFFKRNGVYRLMELAALESGNPNLGLKAYAHFLPGSFQLVGYVMMSSPNLKQALECLARFSPLLGNGFSIVLSAEQGGGLRLGVIEHGEVRYPQPKEFEDAGAATLLGFCRWLMGGHLPQLLQLEFTQAEPQDVSEYRRLFACPLRFGARHGSILFDRQQLLRPLSTANEALAQLHSSLAEFRLGQLGGASLVARVRVLLCERLGLEGCDMESVAAAFCVSKRTLQRGLEKEGVKFAGVLDDVRRQLADHYLRHSQHGLAQVGELLGFKDQSSFHKACLRWFGKAPGRYRLSEGYPLQPGVSGAAQPADEQCVGEVDEEATDQRHDDEGAVRRPILLDDGSHVDYGCRG